MPARVEDDFSAFSGREQMFFGLRDPYGLIRSEIEDSLREQIADTVVSSITTRGEPKFLTLGRQGDDQQVVVTHFAFCVRAQLTVRFDAGRKGERIEATLTFLFGGLDRSAQRYRRHLDMHAEAESGFDDALFKQRFLAFRAEAN